MPTGSSGSVRIFSRPYDREQLIGLLRERVPSLASVLPLSRVVLFGSWAAGRATAFSDIDLLVVYQGPPRADAYRLVRQTVGLRGLEPHVHSEEEAQALAPTLAHMTKDGIELV
jgi:predicted nucleotidyltransferase